MFSNVFPEFVGFFKEVPTFSVFYNREFDITRKGSMRGQ
ncbi:hypothetical protein G436_3554 [Leptospira interrogans serovar Hardjo str. Norma]|uniref:Uncharacterized protein n=1 Tax=Leptospira interrogans serovar Hardjo str. Norma TaxID=1279460 RepID=A0A0M5L8U6_LEPIR|nr:hypothetical protein G436_3554 [Leptospira interrogans serovar Hardjo str. Norma]